MGSEDERVVRPLYIRGAASVSQRSQQTGVCIWQARSAAVAPKAYSGGTPIWGRVIHYRLPEDESIWALRAPQIASRLRLLVLVMRHEKTLVPWDMSKC